MVVSKETTTIGTQFLPKSKSYFLYFVCSLPVGLISP